MFKNVRKKLDDQGNLTGYVVEHEQGFHYDVPLDWVDESYSFAAVHEYALAHPDEVTIYVEILEEILEEKNEIDAIKLQLQALDFKTLKATEIAALSDMTLREFLDTEEGAPYMDVFMEKQELRHKIAKLEKNNV